MNRLLTAALAAITAAAVALPALPASALDTATRARDGGQDAAAQDAGTDDDGVRERPIDRLKRRAHDAIVTRIDAMAHAQQRVDGSEHVTDEHRRILTDRLAEETAGLRELDAQIQAAETFEEASRLARLIVTEHWIFARVIPQVHLTLASDRAVDCAAEAQARTERVRAKLADADPNDPDVQEAYEALDAVDEAAQALAEVGTRVPGVVLPITAEDMPDAKDTIRQAREDLGQALRALRRAVEHARDEVEDVVDRDGEA